MRKTSTSVVYLYRITHTASGRCYIGLTIEPRKRRNTHAWLANKLPGRSALIHRAMAKYGRDAFIFEVIASATSWADAIEAERLLILQEDAHVSCGGFNLTQGGEGPFGRTCSQETRDKISASRRGQPGRKISDEEKAAARERVLRMYAERPELRSGMARRSIEARKRNGNMGHGRKHSPERIEKIRQAALKRWANRYRGSPSSTSP